MSAPETPKAAKPRLAVALRYDAPSAPKVVAVGRGELGQRIVDTARAHGVPVQENPALAEALSTIELDEHIPAQLYEAVAVIIAFILRASAQPPASPKTG
ncbi:MAG: type III secretion protein [Phenylobacterium sp.]|uniref:EscU/YscU/HrcU family type III secretion system export apparatus switch protein n=1 Tax=Phenylobacterium sp. TaxID=1871053 RepID=UPI0011FFCA79|nr:EscU/YscU/HrcU family type III secretion system export apparatus switch protein [Phenylobacterium sp.]TAJ68922.1 MAG: type III secretion protein [Phenylobacterium sp.]